MRIDIVRPPLCLLSLLKCNRDSQNKAFMIRRTAMVSRRHILVSRSKDLSNELWTLNRGSGALLQPYPVRPRHHSVSITQDSYVLLFLVRNRQFKLTETTSPIIMSGGAQIPETNQVSSLSSGTFNINRLRAKGSPHVRIFSCKSSWRENSDWNWKPEANKRSCMHTDRPM